MKNPTKLINVIVLGLWLLWQTAGITGITVLNASLGVSNVSVLYLDHQSETLYVGARETILALHPTNLSMKHRPISWPAPNQTKIKCMDKRQSEADCHNYICLLDRLRDGVIVVCGSYAYNPRCAFINPVNFNLVRKEDGSVKLDEGKGLCPFEPGQAHSYVTADGVLYSASSTNFRSTEWDITRVGYEDIHLEKSSKCLSDPEFVGSTLVRSRPDDPKGEDDQIFWFFTENDQEHQLYSRVRVTRVARVCKGDKGGMKTLQKRWSSFLKAPLVCKEAGGPRAPRYDILTHLIPVEHRPGDPDSTHFYGLFTSQGAGERVAAVCVYSLAAVSTVMSTSRFVDTRTCDSANSIDPPQPRPGQCINNHLREMGYNSSLKLPDTVLSFSKDHTLLFDSVETVPLLVRRGITYTTLAVSNVTGSDTAILHLGTDQGELHSVSLAGRSVSLLHEISLTTTAEPINNIKLYEGRALVGSPSSLFSVPVSGCAVYSGCEVCVRAHTLGCVWDTQDQACVMAETLGSLDYDPLKRCGQETGDCSPSTMVLYVTVGLTLLLPCLPPLSPSPHRCSWSFPPSLHTYQQPSSSLELRVSFTSAGLYSCFCPSQGKLELGTQRCLTASYRLVVAEPRSDGRPGPSSAGAPVGVFLTCVLAGLLLGALIMEVVLKRHHQRRQPVEDRGGLAIEGGTDADRSPRNYDENEAAMSDMAMDESGDRGSAP